VAAGGSIDVEKLRIQITNDLMDLIKKPPAYIPMPTQVKRALMEEI
jgi:hypothetical protein